MHYLISIGFIYLLILCLLYFHIWGQICTKEERLQVLLQLLDRDGPKSGIIFVSEQVRLSYAC
jgi:hypothetical protein